MSIDTDRVLYTFVLYFVINFCTIFTFENNFDLKLVLNILGYLNCLFSNTHKHSLWPSRLCLDYKLQYSNAVFELIVINWQSLNIYWKYARSLTIAQIAEATFGKHTIVFYLNQPSGTDVNQDNNKYRYLLVLPK